jgi:hypothetical protein
MRIFILSLIPILFYLFDGNANLFCKKQKHLKNHFIDARFEIIKIDSIENVYLIYAKRNDSLVKIVSAKEYESSCKKITIGGKYELKISSIVYQFPGKRHISGVKFNNTIVRMEGGNVIWDLFISENIKGLCFLPNVKMVYKE